MSNPNQHGLVEKESGSSINTADTTTTTSGGGGGGGDTTTTTTTTTAAPQQSTRQAMRSLTRASSLQSLPSHQRNFSTGSNIPSHPLTNMNHNQHHTNNVGELIKGGESTDSHPAPSSKYDFVKVKVWLEDHYYVLSRFLISRVLNVTKVDAADSVKISLELKKRLVDQGRLSLTQPELENELFDILQSYGYGNEYIERYRMTTQFHHQRVPLIILISGPKCIGKSYLATQLAERLNLSTVLQTTLVQDLMHAIITELATNDTNNSSNNGEQAAVSSPKGTTMFGMPSDPPIVFKKYKTKDDLISEFKKECVMIRHGVDTDIEKCFEEGKAIIIEGPHIDPSLFTELISERNIFAPSNQSTNSPFTFDGLNISSDSDKDKELLPSTNNNNNNQNTNNQNNNNNVDISPKSLSASSSTTPTTTNNNSSNSNNTITTTVSPNTSSNNITITPPLLRGSNSGVVNSSSPSPSPSSNSLLNALKKQKTKGIIIPFVLSVKETDHRLLVENWLSCSPIDSKYASTSFGTNAHDQIEGVVDNLQTIQNYLEQCQSSIPTFQSVQVNPHSMLETLDLLHSAVLKKIHKAYSGHHKGFEYE